MKYFLIFFLFLATFAYGAESILITAGEALSTGDGICRHPSDGYWYKISTAGTCDTSDKRGYLIVLSDMAQNDVGDALLNGTGNVVAETVITAGQKIYIDPSDSKLTNVAQSADYYAGIALTTTAGASESFSLYKDFGGSFVQWSVVSTTITTDTDNLTVTGLPTAGVLRISNTNSYDELLYVSGLQTGVAGRTLIIQNTGSKLIMLLDQMNGLSTAANRFDFDGYDYPLFGYEQVELVYDGTTSRWTASPFNVVPKIRNGASFRNEMVSTVADSAFYYGSSNGGYAAYPASPFLTDTSVVDLGTGTNTNGTANVRTQNKIVAKNYGASYQRFEASIGTPSALSDGTNNYWLAIGYSTSMYYSPENGTYLRYNHSGTSGNWYAMGMTASSNTCSVNTNVAVGASTHYRITITIIQRSAHTSAEHQIARFFIDGVLKATCTDTTPNTMMFAFYHIEKVAGTSDRITEIGYMDLLAYYTSVQ